MRKRLVVWLLLLGVVPVAHANGFMPTMIVANVLWLVVLPVVSVLEGAMMKRWGWQAPYKNSFWANFWSMIAAIPVGLALSYIGGYLVSFNGKASLDFIPETVSRTLAGIFLYGHLPAPSYGYITSHGGMASLSLAGLAFIGICWALTFAVEAYYHRVRNPSMARSVIYRGVAVANLVSYSLLLLMWLPYSYFSAIANESMERHMCTRSNTWSSSCLKMWSRYPELKTERLKNCEEDGVDATACITPPPGLRIIK
jgi:hypothetical protein